MSTAKELDLVFGALGHETRRGILEDLRHGSKTVLELAAPHPVSLNAVSKHLKRLETAGFVRRTVDGSFHRIETDPRAMQAALKGMSLLRAVPDRQPHELEDVPGERHVIPSFERTVHIEYPVQQAFNAWADATTFSRWFAPLAETEPEVDIDFRVGGSYEIRMALGPGHVHLTHGEYREVERDRYAPDPASPQFEFNPLRCSSGSTLGSAPRKLR